MFADKFDALMNIAEVSNSILGRAVNMSPSNIGRLRCGARPLPKKHDYLSAMCRYIAGHIRKEYQVNAVLKLTDISASLLSDTDSAALYLERWLLDKEEDSTAATGRFISGFSKPVSKPDFTPSVSETSVQKYSPYLYGNAGKRKAVEQFFSLILQAEKPQTLLLFSDENMAWLYEDPAFAAKWTELFTKVILKGNRVKIIHTVSRDMNEMLEAVTKWVPIYMTGMIEPYCYPRLRDGIFQCTLFIAPETCAVVSSSVQQDTDKMLNLFITDKAAVDALTCEYEHYFSLCRPLMKIFTSKDEDAAQSVIESLFKSEGNTFICSSVPPLFTMPKENVPELSSEDGYSDLIEKWQKSVADFENNIVKQKLTLILSDPESENIKSGILNPPPGSVFSVPSLPYTREQYTRHIEYLRQLEKKYDNLKVVFTDSLVENTVLFVKEDTGVIMVKTNTPNTAFAISERNMVNAFLDYVEKCLLGGQ